MKYVIYHREDLDGKGSASILQYFLKEDLEFIGYNYEEDYAFLDKIPDGATVFQVDCSFPNEIIEKLMKRCEFIWIDHHQSAVDCIKGTEIENCKGLRVIGKAACELTWEWCVENFDLPEGASKELPPVIKYLGRKDVWDQSYFPKAKYIDISLTSLDLDPCEENKPKWKLLLEASDEDLNNNVERGKKIWKYLTSTWGNEIPKMVFRLIFGDDKVQYKVVAANHDKGSDFYEEIPKDSYDFKMTFWIEKDMLIHYSLYTEREDISMVKACEYLSEQGAHGSHGGHDKAASFMSDKLPWELPNIKIDEETEPTEAEQFN